jgi:hypothetical protein
VQRVEAQEGVVVEANSFLDQLKANIMDDVLNQRKGNELRRKKMKECKIGME